jgi:UDP-glucose 4,6-dehydratase
MIQRNFKVRRAFKFWKDDEEFYRLAASAPRSNCVLDTTKLLATGVKMRPVEEAMEESLLRWSSAV